MSGSAPRGTASAPERKTIGSVACDAIREGLTNEQALERVLIEFPYARTTKAAIGKYRRILRNKGEEVPTAAEARAAGNPSRLPGETSDWRRSAPPPEPKRKTVSSVAMGAIREGKTTKQVVMIVKAQFPDARISESSVNSYRSRLRGRGENVPTAREASGGAAAGFDLRVADLEEVRAARTAMATKIDLAAMEGRLTRRIAGVVVMAGIAIIVAVKMLS